MILNTMEMTAVEVSPVCNIGMAIRCLSKPYMQYTCTVCTSLNVSQRIAYICIRYNLFSGIISYLKLYCKCSCNSFNILAMLHYNFLHGTLSRAVFSLIL